MKIWLSSICAILAMTLSGWTANAQSKYPEVEVKANRFFSNQEWGSALAMYTYMLSEKPMVPNSYGRAIVSAEMMGDTQRAMELLKQAVDYSVPLDSVLTNVRKNSFAIGKGNMYEAFMLNAAQTFPWMERPLDAYLLRYYAFRRNGPMMVEYATKMLKSSPKNVEFLLILAEGNMIINQPQEAVAVWQQAVEYDPKCLEAILNLANYYDIIGDSQQAHDWFTKAYEIKPTPYVENKLQEADLQK